jgi:hypothetical protein
MNARQAYNTIYDDRSLKGNVALENIIATDYIYSYYYALYVIEGPFRLGEDIIASDTFQLFHYLTMIPNTFSIALASKLLESERRVEFIWWYLRGSN